MMGASGVVVKIRDKRGLPVMTRPNQTLIFEAKQRVLEKNPPREI
jgi:hypothetical protein